MAVGVAAPGGNHGDGWVDSAQPIVAGRRATAMMSHFQQIRSQRIYGPHREKDPLVVLRRVTGVHVGKPTADRYPELQTRLVRCSSAVLGRPCWAEDGDRYVIERHPVSPLRDEPQDPVLLRASQESRIPRLRDRVTGVEDAKYGNRLVNRVEAANVIEVRTLLPNRGPASNRIHRPAPVLRIAASPCPTSSVHRMLRPSASRIDRAGAARTRAAAAPSGTSDETGRPHFRKRHNPTRARTIAAQLTAEGGRTMKWEPGISEIAPATIVNSRITLAAASALTPSSGGGRTRVIARAPIAAPTRGAPAKCDKSADGATCWKCVAEMGAVARKAPVPAATAVPSNDSRRRILLGRRRIRRRNSPGAEPPASPRLRATVTPAPSPMNPANESWNPASPSTSGSATSARSAAAPRRSHERAGRPRARAAAHPASRSAARTAEAGAPIAAT